MRRHAARVVADVAAHGLTVGQDVRGNLCGKQGLRDVARPDAVRHGHHYVGRGRALDNGVGHALGYAHEFVFGLGEVKHFGCACGGVVCGLEHHGLHSRVG